MYVAKVLIVSSQHTLYSFSCVPKGALRERGESGSGIWGDVVTLFERKRLLHVRPILQTKPPTSTVAAIFQTLLLATTSSKMSRVSVTKQRQSQQQREGGHGILGGGVGGMGGICLPFVHPPPLVCVSLAKVFWGPETEEEEGVHYDNPVKTWVSLPRQKNR